MLAEITPQLSLPSGQRPLQVRSCQCQGTKARKNSSDNHSTFHATLIIYMAISREATSAMVDALDTFLSPLGTLHTRQRHATPISTHTWAPYTNIILPCVNAAQDHPGSFLLGPAPAFHGRHHRACSWILLNLYRSLRTYLSHNLQCIDYLSFCCIFGIRAGFFKPMDSHKTQIPVYYVHTADLSYWAEFMSSITR